MNFKKVSGFIEVVLGFAYGILAFMVYNDNYKGSTDFTIPYITLILGAIVALVLLIQGVINIVKGKGNKMKEIGGFTESPMHRRAEKEPKGKAKLMEDDAEEEPRKIGSSVKVLR